MKKFLYLLTIVLFLGVTACTPKEEESLGREVFALDTVSTFSIWTNEKVNKARAEELLKDVEALLLYYDRLLSRTVETSDVYRLNEAGGMEVPIGLETAYLIEQSLYYSELTQGYFDVSILPVKELWDFKAEHPRLPSDQAIEEARALVSYKNINLGQEVFIGEQDLIKANPLNPEQDKAWRMASLKNGARIDLGAVAKGYIADQISNHLKEQGIEKGIINLGGNILMIGQKGPDQPWKVGVQSPDGAQNSFIATVDVVDASVVTSGVYERYFELDGVRYHHLLNPFTARPTDNGLLSVTIFSDESIVGDALSTSCFVLGPDEGMALVESIPGVEAAFILEDGEILTSSGTDLYNFTLN